jgi:hypothetical protein
MQYDLEKLKADINMAQIVKYVCNSDELYRSGSTLYCKCVSGQHSETHCNHNAVYEKSTHCYTCGENYDAFSYVKNYYLQQGEDLSFPQICEKIGEALGGAEEYRIKGNPVKKEEEEILPLTQEELITIGIHNPNSKNLPNLQELYKINPEDVRNMLLKKAYEKMIFCANQAKEHEDPLRTGFLETYQEVREIYEKLGGKTQKVIRLF